MTIEKKCKNKTDENKRENTKQQGGKKERERNVRYNLKR